jgi:CRP-like cAMP-binding protein
MVLPKFVSSSAVDVLSSVSYFSELDSKTLQSIAQNAIARKYDPGQLVILEGEESTGLYIMQDGWGKVIKIAVDGREQILQFLGPGDTFNAVGVFTEAVNPATVVALEESIIWLIRRAVMLELLEKYPKLARQIIADLSRRIQHLIGLVDDLSLRKLEARMARVLLEHSKGELIERHSWATQNEMAARLGTVPDVINRTLRKLVEEGLIEVSRKEIRILERAILEDKAMLAE